MKPLLIITTLAALATCAQAKLGETIADAEKRLGVPESTHINGPRATYQWNLGPQKDYRFTIEFRDGKSIQETINIGSKTAGKKIDPYLQVARPGKWVQSPDTRELRMNGDAIAYDYGNETIIALPPPKSVYYTLRTVGETIANRQKENHEMLVEVTGLGVTEAGDKAAGISWLRGRVLSKFKEGMLIRDESIGRNILLVGHPGEDNAVDGTEIDARVEGIGTFQYRAAIGGIHTVRKMRYVGNIPLGTTAK